MSKHTIPEILWNTKATHYADPIGLANTLIEQLHDLGDEIEERQADGIEDDLDFIEGMLSAYETVLRYIGVENIPIIERNNE